MRFQSAAVQSSFGLDAGCSDHVAPLLGFRSDEFSEIGRRARKRRRTQIRESRLYLRVSKRNVYLLVQLVDDFGRCVLGAAIPNQLPASKPGRNSLTVGTSGKISERAVVVTANARK